MALRPWQGANNKKAEQAYCKAAEIKNRIGICNRIRNRSRIRVAAVAVLTLPQPRLNCPWRIYLLEIMIYKSAAVSCTYSIHTHAQPQRDTHTFKLIVSVGSQCCLSLTFSLSLSHFSLSESPFAFACGPISFIVSGHWPRSSSGS